MTPDPGLDDLRSCAIDAARTAGSHALRNLHRRTDAVKTFRHDIKLRLDLECQAEAEAVIRRRFPGHALLGEEGPSAPPADPATFEWIIDPIDGTVNFSHGLRMWCCSVAVRRAGHTLAGAVYAPAFDELYAATATSPATLNGQPIRVSSTDRVGAAILLTGLDKQVEPGLPPFALFERLSSAAQRTRIVGSAALDLCQVAAGRADGYFESGIYLWDIAAAGLILERAGGRAEITRHQGEGRLCFIGTNGRIHDEMKSVLSPPAAP